MRYLLGNNADGVTNKGIVDLDSESNDRAQVGGYQGRVVDWSKRSCLLSVTLAMCM